MSDIKEIIEKHLGFLGGTDDKWWLQSSIDYYRKAGKPSGSLYKAVEECMKDYLNSQQPKAVITTVKEVPQVETSTCKKPSSGILANCLLYAVAVS